MGYWAGLLKQLIGGTVENVVLEEAKNNAYDDELVGLRIRLSNGDLKDIIFFSDEEGNNVGRFEIYPSP